MQDMIYLKHEVGSERVSANEPVAKCRFNPRSHFAFFKFGTADTGNCVLQGFIPRSTALPDVVPKPGQEPLSDGTALGLVRKVSGFQSSAG